MPSVHATAIVEPGAVLADDVVVGPYCIVGSHVTLGAGVQLVSHAVVTGRTTIAESVRVFPFASVGHEPQDKKYRGEPSSLEIGPRTVIREHATINPGTEGGGMVTRIGADCSILNGVHVAHDCQIADNVILVNNALLGGHVIVEEFAILGGGSAVHQFSRIGKHAMVGGLSGVEHDVIPYGSVTGNRARLGGLNLVGLKRRGFTREVIHDLRNAYRLLFAQEGTLQERLDDVAQLFQHCQPAMDIVAFIRADSTRAICQPR